MMLSQRLPVQIRASMFYFFFMAAIGTIAPFLYLVYRQHGLSPTEIGLVVAVAHIMNLLAAPLWGGASDLLQRRTGLSLLPLACLGAAPAIFLILPAQGLLPTLLAVIVWGFFAGSIISLADSATFNMLGEAKYTFGRVRVWGSLGAVGSSFLIGQFGDSLGLNIVFPTYFILLVACAILAFGFPRVRYHAKKLYIKDAAKVLRAPQVTLFLAAILVLTAAYMAWRSTFTLFLDDLDGAASVIGTFFALSSLVEMIMAYLSPWILGKIGARNTLVFSYAVFILFWMLCGLIIKPELAISLAVVHGISYGLYDVTGAVYVNEITPPGLTNLAQGIYGGINRGIGSVIGSLAGGFLFQYFGGPTLYRISALLGLVAFGCLLLISTSKTSSVKGVVE